jgi:hypothetical protein
MPRISISYRRADSAGITGRIFDRLRLKYGSESVFIDIDSIPLGSNYKNHIDDTLRATDVLLVIIGPRWLGERPAGGARIGEVNDPVRLELEAALRYGRLIIPVLADGATMPPPDALPESLREFPYINAAAIDSGRFFENQLESLTRYLDTTFATAEASQPEVVPPAQPEIVPPVAQPDLDPAAAQPDVERPVPQPEVVPPPALPEFPAEAPESVPREQSLSVIVDRRRYAYIAAAIVVLCIIGAALALGPLHTSHAAVTTVAASASALPIPTALPVPATGPTPPPGAKETNATVNDNGVLVDTGPRIIAENRLFLPLINEDGSYDKATLQIFQNLGASVAFDEARQRLTFTKPGMNLVLSGFSGTRNGEPFVIDVSFFSYRGLLMTPVRLPVELLDGSFEFQNGVYNIRH